MPCIGNPHTHGLLLCPRMQSSLAALVTVAVYLLARLVHGILTFNSRPDEAKALQKVSSHTHDALHSVGSSPAAQHQNMEHASITVD